MNEQAPECVKLIMSAYEPFFSLDASQTSSIGAAMPIPYFVESVLHDLCNEAIKFLQKWNALVQIRAPIYVIGDIHGNIFDLIRIFILCGQPPQARFLFLGDYVDRGTYSTEVVTLLLAMSLCYPGYIILLRGNHEFSSINSIYGFKEEVTGLYNAEMYEKFNEVFGWLPIGATINNEILCVHGGLSPLLKDLSNFHDFPRPLCQCDHPVVSDLVWSDPSDITEDFVRSKRGSGVQFGTKALAEFLENTGMRKVIRAHQCVQLGVEKFAGECLYTVFSCSNYVDASNNRCGLLFITPELEIQTFSLPPGWYCHRSQVVTEPYLDRKKGNLPKQGQRYKGTMAVSISMQELRVLSKYPKNPGMRKPAVVARPMFLSGTKFHGSTIDLKKSRLQALSDV